jgi:protein SCO1/2
MTRRNPVFRKAGRASVVAVVGFLALFATTASSPAADRKEPLPAELEGVGFTEHLNDLLPLDTPMVDQDGRRIVLGDVLGKGKPVVLTLYYADCPMLCNVTADGLDTALHGLPWTPGKEFDVVSVSIDPKETPSRAKLTQKKRVSRLDRPEAAAGWHILTGREPDIRRIADAVGFRYKYLPDRREYSHAAGVVLVTPEGRIARYLYGVKFDPQAFRLSLLEASQGQISKSTLDQMILYCFHYDPSSRSYAPTAMALMRVGAAATVGLLGLFLATAWFKSTRSRRATPTSLSEVG